MGENDGTWAEYRLMVLDKMETFSGQQSRHQHETREDFAAVFKKLNKIESELEAQKTKTSLLGAMWGGITGVITALIAAFKSGV
jgi:hypothetical protein